VSEHWDHGTDVPDDGHGTDVPDDGHGTDVPDDGHGTDAPAAGHGPRDVPGVGSASPMEPEQTRDDTDDGWGEAPDPKRRLTDHEQWLLDQRPPHWD
jgi:hypothetical protein